MTVLSISFIKYDVGKRGARPQDPVQSRFHFFVDQYPDNKDALDLVKYLAGKELTGRVIEEKSVLNIDRLGTLHFFSSFLPLHARVQVLNGLLIESSVSAQFIQPPLFQRSEYFRWGRSSIAEREDFYMQDEESMIQRLKLYGVEYIISCSERFMNTLLNLKDPSVVLEKRFGRFSLFKFDTVRPRFEEIHYKPYLFVNLGGMNFRDFSERWYIEPELFAYPVIYSNKKFSDLSREDQGQIGGLILSWPAHYPITSEAIEPWIGYGKPIVIIDSVPHQQVTLPAGISLVPDFGGRFRLRQLLDLISHSELNEIKPVVAKVDSEQLKSFQSAHGVVINYGYSPYWKSRNGAQEVYQVTPSMMFVFGRGENILVYD